MLDAPSNLAIQLTLLGSDTWILDMAKPPDKKTDETKTKPLPWWQSPEPNSVLARAIADSRTWWIPSSSMESEERKTRVSVAVPKFKRDSTG